MDEAAPERAICATSFANDAGRTDALGVPIRRRFMTVASASSSTLGSRAIERSAWSRVDPIVRARRGFRR